MATAMHPSPLTQKSVPGRRSRFSAEERRQLVERAMLRLADGVSLRQSANEIGVCYETFRRWRVEQSGTTRLRPIKTRPAAPTNAGAARVVSTCPVLVTAGGHRIEGLELPQLVELVRALG